MKTQTIAITLLSFFALTQTTHAVLGPEFLSSERPHSICAIEFYSEDGGERLDEVCSAVMVSEKHLLTAAHCIPGLPERPHKVICRGNTYAQIKKVTPNANVDQELMIFDESERRYDNAYLELENAIKVPTLQFIATAKGLKDLLARTSLCGIFGHGGFRHEIRTQGLSTNAILKPSDITFDGDLIRIDGFKGRASGLVEPGDSGGSLACLDPDSKQWLHIAQVSGRTMNAISLLAPVYTIGEQLKREGISSLTPLHEELKQKWEKEDSIAEAKKCEQLLARFKGAQPVAEMRGLIECQKDKIETLKERLKTQESVTVKLAPYTLITLDQRPEMIDLDGGRDDTRILTNPNPFSTVEGIYNRFMIKKIEGDVAFGDFIRFGYSDYFSCHQNILCDGGTFKNIRASIHDIILP